jgi:DNA-binding NarL/FixJ family response regulator
VKPFDPDELIARVRRRISSASHIRMRRGVTLADLTTRELEVLSLLAQGLGQDEIAHELVISPKTVGTHIQHTLSKLHVHSRAQAVALAHREGLLEKV